MIEVLTFRLRDGADHQAFTAVNERLQTEFFYLQPGLVRRTTAKSADGTWLGLTHWESAAHADAAEARTLQPNEFTEALAVIDPLSLVVQRYEEH